MLENEVESEDILNHTMWNAWYIRNVNLIQLKPSLIRKGCIYIADLLTENCTFMTLQEFRQAFHVRINWFDFHSLISSIPGVWKRKIKELQVKPERGADISMLQKLKDTTKVTQWVYQMFINQLTISEKYQVKWHAKLGEISENDWKEYNTIVFKCSQSAKLQAFQYKIIHGIVCTNKVLKQCGISMNDNCSFCDSEVETTQHLFVQCLKVKNLWNQLADWLAPCIDFRIHILDEKTVVLGTLNSCLINWLLLQTKYYIYRCRVRTENLCIESLKNYLRYEYQVEMVIAKSNEQKMQLFCKKWEAVKNLFAI